LAPCIYPGLKISVGHRHCPTQFREIVRRKEETTGHSDSDQSKTQVYCLSNTSVLVSNRTVALSNINQNYPSPELEVYVKWTIKVVYKKWTGNVVDLVQVRLRRKVGRDGPVKDILRPDLPNFHIILLSLQ
jgi:hypothetical protein